MIRLWAVAPVLAAGLVLGAAGLPASGGTPVVTAASGASTQGVGSAAVLTRSAARPRAVVSGVQEVLPSGKVRVWLTSNARRVKVTYRTAKNAKRSRTVKIRGGKASLLLPKGASRVFAQAKSTTKLRASFKVPILVATAPTPAPSPATSPPAPQPSPVTSQAATSTPTAPSSTPAPPAGTVGDINADGVVGCADQTLLIADWGTANPRSDLNRDGVVNITDLSILLSHWTAGQPACGLTNEQVAVSTAEQGLPAGLGVQPKNTEKSPLGYDLVGLQYTESGVPVLGAQAVIGVDGGQAVMSNKQTPLVSGLSTTPTTTPAQAKAAALVRVTDALGDAGGTMVAGEPSLAILDPAILQLEYPTEPTLVWQVIVTPENSPAWAVNVDASNASIAWAVELSDSARDRRVCDQGLRDSYSSEVPCSQPERAEGAPASGNARVDSVYDDLGYAYSFYNSTLHRDSFDGAGTAIRATVSVDSTANAQAQTDPVKGSFLTFHDDWEAADDVVGHEFTHLATHHSPAGGLFPTAQAGGINEGLSDVIGEFIDWSNPAGDDSAAVRWKIGEDLSAIWSGRNLRQPTTNGRPTADQVGGVNWSWVGLDQYADSGVVGRFAYLITDGEGSVRALGMTKAANILFTAAQSLSQAATFAELGRQIKWSCSEFVRLGKESVTADDCAQVDAALLATRIVGIDPPSHPKTGAEYIARDPRTGRSLLVVGASAYVIPDGGTFLCLAQSRVVWDLANLKALVADPPGSVAGCTTSSQGPWTYTPTSAGGNTGTDIILRNPQGGAWLVNASGELQPIRDGGTYQCLAWQVPVIWNVAQERITAWQPTSSTPATCGRASTLECSDISVVPNDDGSSAAVALPMTVNFGGRQYSSLWVNNNGNVTFDSAMSTYTPFALASTSRSLIAPFFADVDTRAATSGIASAGRTSYEGHRAFCVNWNQVGYFAAHADKRNTFQLVLVDRADVAAGAFDIVFNYTDIEWETGDASGGSGGFGGASAGVGYANGQGLTLELPGSRVPGNFTNSGSRPLIAGTNVARPGRYVYQIRP